MTTIDLSERDAQMFLDFQRHYAFFALLDRLKVFDIRSGSIKISFDADGVIAGTEILTHMSYPQGKPNLHGLRDV
jgi:hypothetical protein